MLTPMFINFFFRRYPPESLFFSQKLFCSFAFALVIIVNPPWDDQWTDSDKCQNKYKVNPGHGTGKSVFHLWDHNILNFFNDLIVWTHTEINDCIDPVYQEERTDHRKCNFPKTFPLCTALNFSRFIHTRGNRLQSWKENNNLDTGGDCHIIYIINNFIFPIWLYQISVLSFPISMMNNNWQLYVFVFFIHILGIYFRFQFDIPDWYFFSM